MSAVAGVHDQGVAVTAYVNGRRCGGGVERSPEPATFDVRVDLDGEGARLGRRVRVALTLPAHEVDVLVLDPAGRSSDPERRPGPPAAT